MKPERVASRQRVRFSLNRETIAAEVDVTVEAVARVVGTLRR